MSRIGKKPVVIPGGVQVSLKDSIVAVDIANREAPRIVATFPLINSIFGPPTNLAITPDERLAVVAVRVHDHDVGLAHIDDPTPVG